MWSLTSEYESQPGRLCWNGACEAVWGGRWQENGLQFGSCLLCVCGEVPPCANVRRWPAYRCTRGLSDSRILYTSKPTQGLDALRVQGTNLCARWWLCPLVGRGGWGEKVGGVPVFSLLPQYFTSSIEVLAPSRDMMTPFSLSLHLSIRDMLATPLTSLGNDVLAKAVVPFLCQPVGLHCASISSFTYE